MAGMVMARTVMAAVVMAAVVTAAGGTVMVATRTVAVAMVAADLQNQQRYHSSQLKRLLNGRSCESPSRDVSIRPAVQHSHCKTRRREESALRPYPSELTSMLGLR